MMFCLMLKLWRTVGWLFFLFGALFSPIKLGKMIMITWRVYKFLKYFICEDIPFADCQMVL
jgi:hypothetical protein